MSCRHWASCFRPSTLAWPIAAFDAINNDTIAISLVAVTVAAIGDRTPSPLGSPYGPDIAWLHRSTPPWDGVQKPRAWLHIAYHLSDPTYTALIRQSHTAVAPGDCLGRQGHRQG